MIAEVIIDCKAKKLNRKFDYKIPENLADLIEVGSRVLVPFANFKTLEQGYVIKIKDNTEFEVKEIAGLDENLSQGRIELARWMARKYFCNVSECIKLMLTPGTRNKDTSKRTQDKKMKFVYLGECAKECAKKNRSQLPGQKRTGPKCTPKKSNGIYCKKRRINNT